MARQGAGPVTIFADGLPEPPGGDTRKAAIWPFLLAIPQSLEVTLERSLVSLQKSKKGLVSPKCFPTSFPTPVPTVWCPRFLGHSSPWQAHVHWEHSQAWMLKFDGR